MIVKENFQIINIIFVIIILFISLCMMKHPRNNISAGARHFYSTFNVHVYTIRCKSYKF